MLLTHEKELHLLAKALEEYETMSKEEILAVLAGKELPDLFYKQYTHKTESDPNKRDRVPLIEPKPSPLSSQ